MGILQYVDKRKFDAMKAERDALIGELHKANAVIIDLQRNPPKCTDKHLAEIRAQAGRDGFIAGVSLMRGNSLAWLKVDEFANQYADSIRQEK